MAITQSERLEAFRNADSVVAEIYGSLETAILLGSIREKYSIPEGNFTHLVGDTILRLRPRNAFEQSLVSEIGLSPDIAHGVTQELKAFFDKAEGTPRPEANLESKERLDLRPRAEASASGAVGAGGGAPKPLTREELMSALGGRRTMAQDIETLRLKQEGGKSGQ